MSFTKEDYEQLKNRLKELADPGYREFHAKLVPGLEQFFGIRIPKLREVAKELVKQDWQGFLAVSESVYYEEIMLQGMVIGLCKCDIDTRLEYMKSFVPKINNWAVCDTFCSSLKATKKNTEKVRQFLQPYLESDKEFELRFGVVMLMDYYTDDQYIDDTLYWLNHISHNGYYVKMAVAWALSVCFVKQREKTLELFKHNFLDDFTYNKSLQKCRESFRVSAQDKEMLKQMKR